MRDRTARCFLLGDGLRGHAASSGRSRRPGQVLRTTFLLGCPPLLVFSGATTGESPGYVVAVLNRVIVACALQAGIRGEHALSYAESATALKRMALVMRGELAACHAPLRAVGGGGLACRLLAGLSERVQRGSSWGAAGRGSHAALAGELAERYLFFRAAASPHARGVVDEQARCRRHSSQAVFEAAGPLTRELLREPGQVWARAVPTRLEPDATTTMICGFCSTGCG